MPSLRRVRVEGRNLYAGHAIGNISYAKLKRLLRRRTVENGFLDQQPCEWIVDHRDEMSFVTDRYCPFVYVRRHDREVNNRARRKFLPSPISEALEPEEGAEADDAWSQESGAIPKLG